MSRLFSIYTYVRSASFVTPADSSESGRQLTDNNTGELCGSPDLSVVVQDTQLRITNNGTRRESRMYS